MRTMKRSILPAAIAAAAMLWACEADDAPRFGLDDTWTEADSPPDTSPDTLHPDATDTAPPDTGSDTGTDTRDTADAVDVPAEGSEPDAVPGDGEVGDPCAVPSDCGDVPGGTVQCVTNLDLTSIGMGVKPLPGGYCSSVCTADPDCGPGSTCVNAVVTHICLKDCSSDTDCRVSEGYTCETLPYVGGRYCMVPLT